MEQKVCAYRTCESKYPKFRLNVNAQSRDGPLLFCTRHYDELAPVYWTFKCAERENAEWTRWVTGCSWCIESECEGLRLVEIKARISLFSTVLRLRRRLQSCVDRRHASEGHRYFALRIHWGLSVLQGIRREREQAGWRLVRPSRHRKSLFLYSA